MPWLSFPITPDGLLVDVMVNLPAATLQPLRAAGQPTLAAQARGLIDTGSNVTGVSTAILQRLALSSVSRTSTSGIAGSIPVNLYEVSLHIWDQRDPTLPWFPHASLLVMDLSPGLAFDVLIGMDVLIGCKLLVDGPAGLFTLEF